MIRTVSLPDKASKARAALPTPVNKPLTPVPAELIAPRHRFDELGVDDNTTVTKTRQIAAKPTN